MNQMQNPLLKKYSALIDQLVMALGSNDKRHLTVLAQCSTLNRFNLAD